MTVAITFLGDVFPKEPFVVTAELPGVVVLNLESPLTDAEIGYPGKINLRGKVEHLASGFASLPAAVSLANNHILDFYQAGFDDTIAALAGIGVTCFGAGDPADAFRNPAMITVGGVRVALLGYAHASSGPVFHTDEHPGAARLELEGVVADIAASRERGADKVVVVVHWGHEQVTLPSLRCIELGRAMVDAGADLIVGHHAHCIQSYENYRGKDIFYGLGNCVFPAHQSPSYYRADGTASKAVDSRPSPRNRRSLAVTWDPVTGSARITPLYFANQVLRRGRFNVARFRLRLPTFDGYEKRYQRAHNWGKLRHAFARFLSKPKLPTVHHYKTLRRLFRSTPPR